MKKVKTLLSKLKKWKFLASMPPCPQGGVHREVLNVPKISSPDPILPIHQSSDSTSLSSPTPPTRPPPPPPPPSSSSSSSSDYVSEVPVAPMVKWVMVYPRFACYEILLGMSFSVPIALFSVTYERVGGNLVPIKLFESNPHLFEVFNILDALAFTASVSGFLLNTVHKRISKYLAVFAFVCLMVAFYVFLWVLLPSYLKWAPYLLLFLVSVVLLYVHLVKGNKDYLGDQYHSSLGAV